MENLQTYNVIGFSNKYYTLWEVTIDESFITYTYLKNLSFDFNEAKIKANTDKFEETLRGKSKNFIKVTYNNGTTQEFENKDMSTVISSKMPFGKYKGKKIIDIVNDDPQYIVWVIINTSNEKLNTALRTIQPIKDILNNNIDFSKKEEEEKKRESYLNNRINLFKKHIGLDLKWKENKNQYRLESEKITLKAILGSPYLKKIDKKNNKEGIKYVTFNSIPNKNIETTFKNDRRFTSYVAVINNFDLTEYGTLKHGRYTDLNLTEIKNREYKLTGYFMLGLTYGTEINDLSPNSSTLRFICSKLEIV